jgi:DNA-binding transcriptional MocR family regulator
MFPGIPAWIRVEHIWLEVSKTPRATVRELADRTHVSFGSVSSALKFLEACGFISQTAGTIGTRLVLVPLISLKEYDRGNKQDTSSEEEAEWYKQWQEQKRSFDKEKIYVKPKAKAQPKASRRAIQAQGKTGHRKKGTRRKAR